MSDEDFIGQLAEEYARAYSAAHALRSKLGVMDLHDVAEAVERVAETAGTPLEAAAVLALDAAMDAALARWQRRSEAARVGQLAPRRPALAVIDGGRGHG